MLSVSAMGLAWWIEHNPGEPITTDRLRLAGFGRHVFLAARRELIATGVLTETRASDGRQVTTATRLTCEDPVSGRSDSQTVRPQVLDLGLALEVDPGLGTARAVTTTRVEENSAGDFDTWWAAYPHKVGKRTAATAYLRARRDGATPPVLLAAVEAQKTWRSWREGFIPHPATWLNQDRWLDEPPPERAARQAPTRESNLERMRRIGAALEQDQRMEIGS